MSKTKGPLLAVTTFLVCLVLAELFLALVAPVPDPFETSKYYPTVVNQYIRSAFPPDYVITTVAETGLPGVQGSNIFSTNNMGFRGDNLVTPKPPNEFRIFMIGGNPE